MSLQRRITLFMTILILGLLISICTIVNLTIQRSESARLERDLDAVRVLAREFDAEHFRALEHGTRLLADLPQIRAVVSTGNGELIADALEGFRELSHADLLGVVDRSGAVHGIHGEGLDTLLHAAQGGRGAHGYVRSSSGTLLQAVALPIVVGGNPIATLIAAYRFGSAQLERLKRMSRSEFAVLGGDGSVLLSTPALPALGPNLRLSGHILAFLKLEAPDGSETARLVAARPLDEGLATAARLRANVIAVSLVFGFLALCASVIFARSITRPLSRLAQGLRDADPTDPAALQGLGNSPEFAGADQEMQSVLGSFNTLVQALSDEREQAHGQLATRLQTLEHDTAELRARNIRLARANEKLSTILGKEAA